MGERPSQLASGTAQLLLPQTRWCRERISFRGKRYWRFSVTLPFPGANEADLAAKVGASVARGLRQAGQPPPWPDTRESLLELLAVLQEWQERAEATTLYAEHLARLRNRPAGTPGRSFGPDDHIVLVDGASTNTGRGYIRGVQRDARGLLNGAVPVTARLSPRRARQARRRGLRTVLTAYCPELLDQFGQAMQDRADWINEHRKEFDQWFGELRTDEQVASTLASMRATERGLRAAVRDLRAFIAANFPLTGTPRP